MIPISKKQKMILAFPYTKNYQALICDGAVRSGKTSLMTVAFIDWAMREFDGCNFGICGKTVGSAIKNIINPYLGMTYHRKKYSIKFTRSDNKMIVTQGKKTNVFYVYGGKDEASYMLIQGITLAGALLDEVALMTRSFVEQALARCSVDRSRYWFNCNPENPGHWFYKEWVKPENHPKKKVLYIHFLMTDNPSLAQETLDRYNAQYIGVFRQRYILGQWVRAEGAIYPLFITNEPQFKIDRGNVPLFDKIIIGIDWGGNKSAHTFCATGITPGYREIVPLISERHEANGTKPDEVYTLYRKFESRVRSRYGAPDSIYADSEAQTLNNGLKDNTSLPVYNSYKCPVFDRITTTTMLMAQGRFFMTEDCETLAAAFRDAVWDEKHEDERLDDHTSDIDSLDAFEYSWSWYINYIDVG